MMSKEDEDKMKLDRALRDLLLEASEEELREIIVEAGEDSEALEAQGRAAAQQALETTQDKDDIYDLHRGLGALVQMLRRKTKLSIEELSQRAQIDVEQIEGIENDPEFTPFPRTIFQLEEHFKLKAKSLVILSGAVPKVGPEVREAAVRFAASSQNMAALTREERRLLSWFVKFLQEHTD